MRSCFILLTVLSLLGGCVTETSSVTRNKPNVRTEANNQEAAKTRITLALQYLRAGNNSQAKYNLEKALKLAPELPQGHYSLAYYYEQVGEEERAGKAYRKALELDPSDPNTLNNYGTFLCRMGEYQAAQEQFFKAIDVPSYLRVSRSYENLALCAIKQDNFTQAQDYLNSAIAHDGRSQSALISLAALFYAKSDLHQAVAVMENYADKGFISPRSLLLQHLLYTSMGHLQKAQEVVDLLIKTYPESYQAKLVINNELADSEFVRLKEQYRLAQLKTITQQAPAHVVKNPQIKIKRKVISEPSGANPTVTSNSGSVSLRTNAEFTAHSGNKTTIADEQNGSNRDNGKTINSVGKKSSYNTPPPDEQGVGKIRFYEPEPGEVKFIPNSGTIVKMRPVRSEIAASQLPLVNNKVQAPRVPFHIMNAGENVFSLSVKYDIKLVDLLRWNNLKESDKVAAGQKVYLNNPAITHEIKTGETLFTIATQYGLQIDDLMRWNELTPDVALTEGYGILIVDPDSYVL
ncbi:MULTISPECIES: type IV pilus biogenesis/stability protein PilW [Pseudoalteromonas]|uniref:Type IV pilus biogenesis/stability protein PilW n=1 Tax=Pseudoalteromonas amylolytica TaxID=1859457 RepID=A0A1S1MW40_9GAMM|nr:MULTISPECIES: type IV pilus biogenesis/stability protein PilW [Pseudoalteromonas]OHU89051.1 type IV pilus biogenesis/stability protein PilW [Pseudoalteromonas sp. JW3]OHU91951.1 type IV pilus biogenesis/stability protein PilW [Pseudoalteromonas amylolytica]